MADEIRVGSTLYVFDDNRRRYDAERRIIYREHFYPVIVTGETKQSWLAGEGFAQEKIRKSDLTINHAPYGRLGAYTAAGVEEKIWRHENRWRIVRAVENADGATLRAIDALLASGIGAEGQDPKGLGAEPVEPARTPLPSSSSSHNETTNDR